jgi:hypothetical protein
MADSIKLRPEENMALTIALKMIEGDRAKEIGPNMTTVLAWALARVTGREGYDSEL